MDGGYDFSVLSVDRRVLPVCHVRLLEVMELIGDFKIGVYAWAFQDPQVGK